jgi:hypothetical protein
MISFLAWLRNSRAGRAARSDADAAGRQEHYVRSLQRTSTEQTPTHVADVDANASHITPTNLAALKTGPPQIDVNAAASPAAMHIQTELQLGPLAFIATSPSIYALSRISSSPVRAGSRNLDLIQSPSHSLDAAWINPKNSLAAASVLSRTISLRHTPSSLPQAVQSVLEENHAGTLAAMVAWAASSLCTYMLFYCKQVVSHT